ncbi:YybH family protein [Jeongeupia naejangsanensis]|uniref:Nuclear transport factor 2 family protein n=1 Tax=Jeongeupia naejangsanensis TaxID=613195 RepID=A0ABS2BH48_9NEIS|nr:nuclear transport factor 2 family protein [Jeongeupia naejangsanensis]MBM3114785.1 nuclear transport factor 2 family protein [Jeongeupia naejangsanensis]
MPYETDPFVRQLAAYKAAVLAKDVGAFSALYDDEVLIFDMWGAWSLQGIDAWRNLVRDWFASLGDERVIVDIAQPHSAQADTLIVGHAILTFTAIAADGQVLRSQSNRITMALKRIGNDWKVIHEHTSAPLDFQSQQAILRYAPT